MRKLIRILLILQSFVILISGQHVLADAVGIPSPSFGLEPVPAQPSQWPSSQAVGYYYIDVDHPNATDSVGSGDSVDSSGNRFGYPDSPRATIPSSFPAGSFVMLSGTYTRIPQRIQVNGSAQSPVWFVGDPSYPPTFSGMEMIFSGQYLIIDNLKYRDNANLALRNKDGYYFQHHAGIRNLDMMGTGVPAGSGAAIGVSGISSSQRASDIVISNCSITKYGSYTGPTENDFHGIKPGRNIDNVWVLDNVVHHNGGDSIQIGDGSIADDTRPSHIYVSGNEFYSNFENDIDIKEADHIFLVGNDLHGSETSIVVHNESADVWFINNRVYSTEQAANVTSGTNINFIGNTIYDIHHSGSSWDPNSLYSTGAAIHFRGAASGSIVNNTFFAYDTGIQIASVSSLELTNNIFLERSEASAYDVNLASTTLKPLIEFDYNSFYTPSGGERINWATGSASDVQDLVAQGVCSNCLSAVSSPVSSSQTYNFSLQTTASELNSGVDSPIYTQFNVQYGQNIDKDITGSPRILGNAVDIGAYEGAGASPPSPPQLSTE